MTLGRIHYSQGKSPSRPVDSLWRSEAMWPHDHDHLWSFRDPGWDPSILPGWDGSLASEGLRMTFYVFLVTMTSLTMHDLIKYAWRFKYFWDFLRPFKPFLTLWAPSFRSLMDAWLVRDVAVTMGRDAWRGTCVKQLSNVLTWIETAIETLWNCANGYPMTSIGGYE